MIRFLVSAILHHVVTIWFVIGKGPTAEAVGGVEFISFPALPHGGSQLFSISLFALILLIVSSVLFFIIIVTVDHECTVTPTYQTHFSPYYLAAAALFGGKLALFPHTKGYCLILHNFSSNLRS